MRRQIRWQLFFVLFAVTASARLASVEFDFMVVYCDDIVIAKVTELLPTSGSERDLVYASATVKETLKGSLTGSFLFRALPGVICDESKAIKDEDALFFLGRSDDGVYYISQAGRGRMPLHEIGGKTYATLESDVILPKDAMTTRVPVSQYSYTNSVELGYLKALIVKNRDRKPVYSKPEDIITTMPAAQ